MHYLIYISGNTNAGPDQLKAVGLADHVTDHEQCATPTGPDNGRGSLFAWRSRHPQQPVVFAPDRQRWVAAIARDGLAASRFWIGWEKDSPPGPRDLIREENYTGYLCKLGDSHEWIVPNAAMLPHNFRLSNTGDVTLVIQERFREFWEKSRDWYQRFALNPDAEQIKVPADWFHYLTFALSLNYRILPELISELELFTTQNAIHCAMATVDWSEIVAAESQKKNGESPEPPAT